MADAAWIVWKLAACNYCLDADHSTGATLSAGNVGIVTRIAMQITWALIFVSGPRNPGRADEPVTRQSGSAAITGQSCFT